jgi:hypothetical protein
MSENVRPKTSWVRLLVLVAGIAGALGGLKLGDNGWEAKIDLAHSTVEDDFQVTLHGIVVYRSKNAERTMNAMDVGRRTVRGAGAALGAIAGGGLVIVVARIVRKRRTERLIAEK